MPPPDAASCSRGRGASPPDLDADPEPPMSDQPNPIGFVSLGCPKALVDSERIINQLRAEGYGIAADYQAADAVIVNTCGFIDSAIEESHEAIDEALAENGRVIVTGCLGTRAEQIAEAHPEVLAITGPQDYTAVMAAVHRILPPNSDHRTRLLPGEGIRLTPPHDAYLKIAEGCDHRCRFCIIPPLRGDLISRPVEEVLAEAERLVAGGVRELLVIAQDTSAYGVDRGYAAGPWRGRSVPARMTDLAAALGELGAWVRLHYVYPSPHVDTIIPWMAAGRVLPYLDIPLQHASPTVLRTMRRPAAGARLLERLGAWRQECPNLTLRSTFMVGFPGETEGDFEQLLEFLEAAEIDRVGAFAYSPVEGAPANHLDGAVPEAVRVERLERLMAVQAEISRSKLARRVGETTDVLVDAITEDGTAITRSPAEAPEVDGVVQVDPGAGSPRPGEWLRMRIHDHDDHDLFAEPVPPSTV